MLGTGGATEKIVIPFYSTYGLKRIQVIRFTLSRSLYLVPASFRRAVSFLFLREVVVEEEEATSRVRVMRCAVPGTTKERTTFEKNVDRKSVVVMELPSPAPVKNMFHKI